MRKSHVSPRSKNTYTHSRARKHSQKIRDTGSSFRFRGVRVLSSLIIPIDRTFIAGTIMDFTLNLEQSEQHLVTACIRGERWAQQRIYEDYYGSMMPVCLRYAANQDEALDMLQEGFIKVFSKIGKYQPGTSLGAWIRTLMVNSCIDAYRRNARRRTEDIDQLHYVSYDAPDALSNISEKEILEAVQSLSPAYRAVFNLYAVEGYSHKEIGEALNITESTSRSNLVKARVKLKDYFIARKMVFDYAPREEQ
jgi:RNA polymerase sigma factor (sigma-70 family)